MCQAHSGNAGFDATRIHSGAEGFQVSSSFRKCGLRHDKDSFCGRGLSCFKLSPEMWASTRQGFILGPRAFMFQAHSVNVGFDATRIHSGAEGFHGLSSFRKCEFRRDRD